MSEDDKSTPEGSTDESTNEDTVEISAAELDKLKERAEKLDEFRSNNRELYGKLEQYGDIAPEDVKRLRQERQELENRLSAAKKGLDEEELEEELQKRYSQAIEKEREEREQIEQQYQATAERLREVLLDNSVVMAAKSHDDFIGHAIPDAQRLVRDEFEVKDGDAVHRDGAMDEDGEPLSPEKMIELTKKKGSKYYRPHWWSASASGGGATGTDADTRDSDTVTREELQKMPPQKRLEFFQKGGRVVDAA